jgi:serine/threonine protein kinase/tetratricopeptide (TPR) repeat protein
MTSPAISGYNFETCHGSGAFGTVWKALWNNEFECAVKVLNPGTWHPQYLSWCLERLRREGARPGLVRIYSYDLANEPPHLSMAHLPEGTLTLEQLSGRLPAREAWALLDSLAETLAWLHSEGIVHTGLSSGNVFVGGGAQGEPVLLLGDVGQGWLTDAPVQRLHGQMAFIAPEQWRAATRLLQEGRAQQRDVYAFGVVAWRLLTGTWPRGAKVFDAISASQNEELNIQSGPFADWLENEALVDWPEPVASGEESARCQLVERCLSFDTAIRFPDMRAVHEALRAIALPLPAAAPAEQSLPEAADANADGKVDTADAFVPDNSSPRRGGFRIPFFRLRSSPRPDSGAPAAAAGRGGWRLAAGIAILGAAVAAAWGVNERDKRITAGKERDALRRSNEELSSRLPRLEGATAAAEATARAARAEQAAGARHDSVELIRRVLDTRPVEDSDLAPWRLAVRAVADQYESLLDGAPADAVGMEARWQLARLQSSLGDSEGALPVLEKLSRDLEAAAIAAGTDFPAELIRLTGRVSALTGQILTSQNRTDDALPCLRRASDSLEKWLATDADDQETARTLAHNLLLEGRTLAARGQTEQARSALMKIESMIREDDSAGFKAEDYLLLADVQKETGRLDTAQATQPSTDPGADASATRLLESATARYVDAINTLLKYDSRNKRSVACRTRLARCYYEMGRVLVRSNSSYDASVAFAEGVKIYTELVNEFPENTAYKFDIAALYNEAAQLIYATEAGLEGAKKAQGLQDFSVRFMEGLNDANPLDNAIRLQLAASFTLNGELLQARGESTGALKRQTEAINITAELLAESTLSEKERREARRISARAWTATAKLHEKAGPSRRDATVDALMKALAEWESLPVEDPSDQQKMTWVQTKLNALKPEKK